MKILNPWAGFLMVVGMVVVFTVLGVMAVNASTPEAEPFQATGDEACWRSVEACDAGGIWPTHV